MFVIKKYIYFAWDALRVKLIYLTWKSLPNFLDWIQNKVKAFYYFFYLLQYN